MVASNFLGFFNCSSTIFDFCDLLLEASSKSDLLNEKKATSVPEINADKTNKPKSIRILIVSGQSKDNAKYKLGGSGSNNILFS